MTPVSPITSRFIEWLQQQGYNPDRLSEPELDRLSTDYIVRLLSGQFEESSAGVFAALSEKGGAQ